jgi:hypothetical protein
LPKTPRAWTKSPVIFPIPKESTMPKLDLDSIAQSNATGYPAPFDEPVQGRWCRRLAGPGGLTRT